MTASMTVPLQTSQNCIDFLAQALEVPADAEVQGRELPTVYFETRNADLAGERSSARRRRNVRFPASSPHLAAPPFTTGPHGMISVVVSHERIMAPNGGARFMICSQSLRRLKLPASFQPLATVRNSEYHVDASPLAIPVLRFDPQLLNLCPRSESEKEATLDDTARVPDVSATRDWIPFRIFGSLFMKLFHPALTNQEQHNFGPIPHLFPWPSMTVVCCLALRAQAMYMGTHHLGHFTGLPMCSSNFPLKQRIVSNWE